MQSYWMFIYSCLNAAYSLKKIADWLSRSLQQVFLPKWTFSVDTAGVDGKFSPTTDSWKYV